MRQFHFLSFISIDFFSVVTSAGGESSHLSFVSTGNNSSAAVAMKQPAVDWDNTRLVSAQFFFVETAGF